MQDSEQCDDRTFPADEGTAGSATPAWITPELVQRTIEVWQPYYATTLSPEDAVTMILSVGRLYDVLAGGQGP